MPEVGNQTFALKAATAIKVTYCPIGPNRKQTSIYFSSFRYPTQKTNLRHSEERSRLIRSSQLWPAQDNSEAFVSHNVRVNWLDGRAPALGLTARVFDFCKVRCRYFAPRSGQSDFGQEQLMQVDQPNVSYGLIPDCPLWVESGHSLRMTFGGLMVYF